MHENAPAAIAGGGREAALPWWLQPGLLVAIVLVLAALRTWVAASTNLVADEAYYTLWSLHPAFGYLDHPPGIAWLIGLGRLVAGESEFGVRLVALLAPLGIALALYRTGVLLFDRRAAGLAVLWYSLSFAVALSFLATPDVPSTLFWMLAVWALAELEARKDGRWWLLVGLFAGLGVLGKYTNLFLGPGIVLFLLTSAERRRWLTRPALWAGGAVALAVVTPNLWWNWQHDWATARFQGGRLVVEGAGLELWRNYSDLIASLLVFLGPLTTVFAGMALIRYLLAPRLRQALALPLVTSLPALAYFFWHAWHAHVEANWLLPLWPMLALAAAAAALDPRPRQPWRRRLGRLALHAQTLLGVALIATLFAIVVLKPASFAVHDRTRDMQGWAEARAEIDRLATAAGAGFVATDGGYGLVSLLASYGHFNGSALPVVPLAHPYRYTFLPQLPATTLAGAGVYVAPAGTAAPPPGLDAEAELLGMVARRSGPDVREQFAVFRIGAPAAAGPDGGD